MCTIQLMGKRTNAKNRVKYTFSCFLSITIIFITLFLAFVCLPIYCVYTWFLSNILSSFFFALIVSILPVKYYSQMTNSLIFSSLHMTSYRQNKNLLHAIKIEDMYATDTDNAAQNRLEPRKLLIFLKSILTNIFVTFGFPKMSSRP